MEDKFSDHLKLVSLGTARQALPETRVIWELRPARREPGVRDKQSQVLAGAAAAARRSIYMCAMWEALQAAHWNV